MSTLPISVCLLFLFRIGGFKVRQRNIQTVTCYFVLPEQPKTLTPLWEYSSTHLSDPAHACQGAACLLLPIKGHPPGSEEFLLNHEEGRDQIPVIIHFRKQGVVRNSHSSEGSLKILPWVE